MKKTVVSLLVLPVLLAMIMTPAALANGTAIGTMAGIIMHLNHYPGSGERKVLDGIVNDKHATSGEKALAGALMRMQHRVGGADAARLRELISDKHASKAEQTLADILLGIAHHPSGSDRQRLKALIE